MSETPKKLVAALAAVGAFLQAEAEAALQPEAPAAREPAAFAPRLWALNGRQTQMQMRNLMQLRTFSRI
jgi:hypothetical protein